MFRQLIPPALVLVSLVGCAEPPPAPSLAPPPAMPVTTARPLVKGIVDWHRYTGRLEPVESVEIRARVSGYIDAVHFTEGEIVEEGALLFVIDPRPFEAALKRARAAQTEATARIVRARAQVIAVEAQLERAKAERTLAATRLDNAERALAADAIAKELVDARRSEAAQAEAAVLEAQAAIAAAEADIETAVAAEATATAALEQAELDLLYTRVEAPISGRIGRRHVTRGNLIQGGSMGSTLLTTIVTLDPVHVYMDADEQAYLKYTRQAQRGDRPSSRETKIPIYVALSDETGYPHKGYIDFVDNRIDPATGTMRARGILSNSDLTLTAGLFATVQVPGSARYDAVLIPDGAVVSDQARRMVYVVADDGSVEPRPVELGPLSHGLRVVRSGLTGDEQIVIRGLQRVRPGVTVVPQLEELTLTEEENGLPDEFEPVPPEEFIRVRTSDDTEGQRATEGAK